MTNTNQNKLSTVRNDNLSTSSEKRPSFLEKILSDESYNCKEKREGFSTKILQDRSNKQSARDRAHGYGWEKGDGWDKDCWDLCWENNR